MKTIFALLLMLGVAAQAGPRTSASYTISADTADYGGQHATSASYTSNGSVGTIAGVATSAAQTAKNGYLAQLFDVTGLALSAASTSVNEESSFQLVAWQVLDDATFLAVAGTAVSWTVLSGPVASISSAGLATAGNVYQDTAANVRGSFGGFSPTLGLTVLDVGADDFGLYASDGVPDSWQVQYFGEENPAGAADADGNGNGQTNRLKYLAGLDPTNPAARFNTTAAMSAGQHTIVLSPIAAGVTYVVEAKTDLLAPAWQPLVSFTTSDDGNTRTVTDLDASGPKKFYRVVVSRP